MARLRIKRGEHSYERLLREANYRSEPIALVENPLQYLRGGRIGEDRKVTRRRCSFGDLTFAQSAADTGRGHIVQNIAREVAHGAHRAFGK
jgi:hypothetical protein